MPLNIELAEQVLAKIAEKPLHHNQASWRDHDPEGVPGCGTTMCIAGWAGALAGGRWVSDDPDHLLYDDFVAEPADDPDHVNEWEDDAYVSARYRGQRVLGLTQDRANDLFETTDNEEAIAKLRRSIRSAKAARTRRGGA